MHRRFSVVVSVCLLSQMVDSLEGLLTSSHARFQDAVVAMRNTHLALLANWTRARSPASASPTGWAALISDMVSSTTVPELTKVADDELLSLQHRLVEQHNFFHGALA